jgi:hypothetical protein
MVPTDRPRALASSEYQLKAAFLFNFLQFVEWPDNAFADDGHTIIIGILGPDPFGAELDAVMQGERINGRELRVERYMRIEDAQRCNLLFISQTSAEKLHDSVARLKGHAVLTVGDAEAFTAAGGMIGFVTEENRIRLYVNLQAATDAQLKLSSKLLRRSTIVASLEK